MLLRRRIYKFVDGSQISLGCHVRKAGSASSRSCIIDGDSLLLQGGDALIVIIDATETEVMHPVAMYLQEIPMGARSF